jgi:hypothetical protein
LLIVGNVLLSVSSPLDGLLLSFCLCFSFFLL